MRIDGREVVASGVVAWLQDAVAAGPKNPNEVSPAERLQPALEAASASERHQALIALVDALEGASDGLRIHLLCSLQGFQDEELTDRFADLLAPVPPAWLGHEAPDGGGGLASILFGVLAHGPGTTDERLIIGLRRLARHHGLQAQALPHFVTFHPADHGLDVLSEFIQGGGTLEPGLAWRFGGRFARDAAAQLPAVARLLEGQPQATRETFLEGASPRLSDADQRALRGALGLPTP